MRRGAGGAEKGSAARRQDRRRGAGGRRQESGVARRGGAGAGATASGDARPASPQAQPAVPGPPGHAPHRSRRPPRCSITCRVTATLHRSGDFLPSTHWGLRSCPDRVHRQPGRKTIRPGQALVDSWTNDLHRLWTTRWSTSCARSCPPATHRLGAVVPSDPQLLHMPVHCSATRRAFSPRRVKAVTQRCRVGLWERGVKLGTALGRTRPRLCMGCAELSVLHRGPRLSTGSTHRARGQNLRAELGKRGYPRYPQALLLPTTRESPETVSKRALCTTRPSLPDCPSARLDPERHLLSVRCVRLVPGVLPLHGAGDTETDDEGEAGREAPATAGGGLR